ncbi:uncharacterized protein LOC111269424 isoform X1 [Varroa jacobsoni]|uniref:uncharacterized protein LOC111269424 isoform X1 n=1 Tax=Varroa jacobsoni TaxID=62625 RepID=UPI000BF5E4E8|nr:uncharacterized protein LOC111269424 isoform X1 [Varroa jacobsoni]
MSRVAQMGRYRLSSLDDLNNVSFRASLERRSTAFDFGRVGYTTAISEEAESVEFRWQEAIEYPGPCTMLRPQEIAQNNPAPRRIFTITQQMIESNAFDVPEPIELEHESFLGERRKYKNQKKKARGKKRRAAGEEKAGPPNLLVFGRSRQLSDTVPLSQKMLVMALLGRNRPAIQRFSACSEISEAHSTQSSEYDALYSSGLIICELRVILDNAGYQLCVIPDFSLEPYLVRTTHSEDTYCLQLSLLKDDLAPLQPPSEDGVAGVGSAVRFAICPRETILHKRRAQMALAQPKESHVRISIFGEIECAIGFPRNQSIFVLYTSSSPKGWSLLGSRREDELNATFSATSLLKRNSDTGSCETVAVLGHPFHFNFTSTDENNTPTLHFKVVHFDPETGRFHTLGEGRNIVDRTGNSVLRVPLIRRLPEGLVARLKERFLGGDPVLRGIVINQTIPRECITEPAGELAIRIQIVRQSQKYRLEDLLNESRLRLLKSSGRTLSTVQSTLSAFQEARVRMIQARQE